jgi:hypothetical protein
LNERRAAMELWCSKFQALEAGEPFNVVALRAA